MRCLFACVAALVTRPLICGSLLLSAGQAAFGAEDVASFYQGRAVSMIVGYSPGGGFDIYARLLARYLGDHIPGQPRIVVRNMSGAGGQTAALNILNIAPKDGTTIGMFGPTVPFAPLLYNQNFDGRLFNWIGSITNEVSVCLASPSSPVKSWEDMLSKTFVVGGEGPGADINIQAHLLRTVFGAKIRLITGYPGSNEIKMAIERQEVNGICGLSYSTVKTSYARELRDKKILVLLQVSLTRSPDLPDVPFIGDFATPEQYELLRLPLEPKAMARPFAVPPGVPSDRLNALRDAFDRTMRDPRFLADAERTNLDVRPMRGADMMKLVADLYETPKDIVEKIAKAISGQ
jgi:tripartite-type tricarboxylate transporter receptor subunit TctC